jgi:ribosomal protein S18 acetylase RimI-like enzyme
MPRLEYLVSSQLPSVAELNDLRAKVGWEEVSFELVKKSLNNSLFCVCIRKRNREQRLLGMGRVIGDGAMYFYIQDIMVDPDYQNTGLGALLMQSVEEFIFREAQQGATVGLLAAKGAEGFYHRYGYQERSGAPLGMGMCKFI